MKTFMIVWAGQVVSAVGSSLSAFVLAVWVYQSTGSVTALSLILLTAVLPGVLLAPVAGVLIDRWRRRPMMMAGEFVAALAMCSLAVAAMRGDLSLSRMYATLVVVSACGLIGRPALLAALPSMVPVAQLGRANGLLQLGPALARLVAPTAAAFLVLRFGISTVLLLDALSFLVAFGTLAAASVPDTRVAEGPASMVRFRDEFTAGWLYIAATPALLALLIYYGLVNLTVGLSAPLLTPLILSFAAPRVLGAISSLAGAGMLIGTIAVAISGGPRRRVAGILWSTALLGAGLVAMGASRSAVLIALGVLGFSFAIPVINTCDQVIWQRTAPPQIQGRVLTIRMMIASVAAPLAYAVAGPLDDHVFEPLLVSGGALSQSVGRFLGVGAGRGTGLLLVTLGCATACIAGIASALRMQRSLDSPAVTPELNLETSWATK